MKETHRGCPRSDVPETWSERTGLRTQRSFCLQRCIRVSHPPVCQNPLERPSHIVQKFNFPSDQPASECSRNVDSPSFASYVIFTFLKTAGWKRTATSLKGQSEKNCLNGNSVPPNWLHQCESTHFSLLHLFLTVVSPEMHTICPKTAVCDITKGADTLTGWPSLLVQLGDENHFLDFDLHMVIFYVSFQRACLLRKSPENVVFSWDLSSSLGN